LDDTFPPDIIQPATVDETSPNAASGMAGDANQFEYNAFTEQVTNTSPVHQTNDAHPLPDMPLANTNPANDQLNLAASTAQALNAEPLPNTLSAGINMGRGSPIDFDTGFASRVHLSADKAELYSFTQAYPSLDPLSSQYPSSPPLQATSPDLQVNKYPVPSPARNGWPNLERNLSQQGRLGMAGANAIFRNANSYVSAAENDNLDLHFQDEPVNTTNAVDTNGFTGLQRANEVDDPTQHDAPSQGTANSAVPSDTTPTNPITSASHPAIDLAATAPAQQNSVPDTDTATSPVITVKQETKMKTSASKKKSTSKAKQQAVKVTLYNSQLLVSSTTDAKQIAITRIPLNVPEDDLNEVETNPAKYVPKIAKALDGNYRIHAEDDERVTEEGRKEFERWQKEHENKAWAIINKHADMPKFAQACARIFYDKVVEAHKIGLEDVAKTISNGGADLTMKCSERINAAIKAIEDYSIVKYDFIKQDRLQALAASPTGFVARKVENMWVNYKKKPGTGPVKVEADEQGSVAASKAKS
jgi:hypothetical protein